MYFLVLDTQNIYVASLICDQMLLELTFGVLVFF